MDSEELAGKSVGELRKLAADRMIPGRAEMKKEHLVVALSEYSLEERVRHLEARVSALESDTGGTNG